MIQEMLQVSTELLNSHIKIQKALERSTSAEQAHAQMADEDSPFFRGRKLFQLDVNYRWSSIVLDERFEGMNTAVEKSAYGAEGHAARAGDRAPDAPDLLVVCEAKEAEGLPEEGNKTRLFDLFTPMDHTVLIFAPVHAFEAVQEIIGALEKYPRGLVRPVLILPKNARSEGLGISEDIVVLQDAEGHAYTGYGLPEDILSVAIVRPDGVIGAFVKGTAGADRYFSLIFKPST